MMLSGAQISFSDVDAVAVLLIAITWHGSPLSLSCLGIPLTTLGRSSSIFAAFPHHLCSLRWIQCFSTQEKALQTQIDELKQSAYFNKLASFMLMWWNWLKCMFRCTCFKIEALQSSPYHERYSAAFNSRKWSSVWSTGWTAEKYYCPLSRSSGCCKPLLYSSRFVWAVRVKWRKCRWVFCFGLFTVEDWKKIESIFRECVWRSWHSNCRFYYLSRVREYNTSTRTWKKSIQPHRRILSLPIRLRYAFVELTLRNSSLRNKYFEKSKWHRVHALWCSDTVALSRAFRDHNWVFWVIGTTERQRTASNCCWP